MPARRAVLSVICVAVIVTLHSGSPVLRAAQAVPDRAASGAQPVQPAQPESVPLDVVALDRNGRSIDDLGPQEFSATIDGVPRRIVSVQRISRGPGAASDASSRQAAAPAGAFGWEPMRTVVIVIDQTMLARGDERTAVAAATALVDRLGLDDRVAVVRLPLVSNASVALVADRPAAHEALRAVAGLDERPGVRADEAAARAEPPSTTGTDPGKVVDPDKASTAEQPPIAEPAVRPSEDSPAKVQAIFGGLQTILQALQKVPGRKVVALFSAGVPPLQQSLNPLTNAVALQAASARAVIYAFGVTLLHPDDATTRDSAAIELLAEKSGGMFTRVQKDAVKTVDPVVRELASCYVLRLEGTAQFTDGKAHAVRVETSRKGVKVRAPAMLVARHDPTDPIVAVADERAPADEKPAPVPAPRGRDASREADLQMILSRVSDYVQGYQRAFSGLVAEEEYRQSASGKKRVLRSDFLLVKLENLDYWVSFRDVFNVDGKAVRDREDRLKRLFLDDRNAEASPQVMKIKEESARYNIGPIERNFNEPLFPLAFLLPGNQGRFRFSIGKRGTTGGVETWRIDYEELVRPTLITTTREGKDVPAKGSFLVDAVTGAVLETALNATEDSVLAHFLVQYRRDDALGLWVPVQMTESYNWRQGWMLVAEGQATYTKFRRFQVKTEEKITVPK